MQFPVLIELLPEGGFRASSGHPLALSVEAKTRDEAVHLLRELIEAKLTIAREVTQLEIDVPENPWLRVIGTLDPDDPVVQGWERAMKENREEAENDPNYL
jgi:hypothetical protein